MAYVFGGTDCSVKYIKINPRTEKSARQYGRRRIDVMNSPAGFQDMRHYLLSDRIVDLYGWAFLPLEENGRPINGFVFDDFTARINLSPRNFDPKDADK